MTAFKAWLAQPYEPSMSAAMWVAFLGFVIIVSIAWVHLFEKHLRVNNPL